MRSFLHERSSFSFKREEEWSGEEVEKLSEKRKVVKFNMNQLSSISPSQRSKIDKMLQQKTVHLRFPDARQL